MRRQDIQLLAAARAGDLAARCEVGRRYLLGDDGFPHHVPTGIAYLTHEGLRGHVGAQRTLAEALPLQDLMAAKLFAAVEAAARAGSVQAQIKAAAWCLLKPDSWNEGAAWLDHARQQGSALAQQARAAAHGHSTAAGASAAAFQELAGARVLDAVAVLLPSLSMARARADVDALLWGLRLAQPWLTLRLRELAEFVVDAVDLCEQRSMAFRVLSASQVQAALEHRLGQGDVRAAYQLGRALAGLPCADIPAAALVTGGSLRRAAALLLRAADGGIGDAWLHLYRLSSDHRCTVANPQMARFFLEKSAAAGNVESQRRLGTLLLRQSEDVAHSELALHWLSLARAGGDDLATQLLASLVLPVAGADDEAEAALRVVQRADPWLAARLSVARCFGLTRLEAMALDPARALRPWGLVAGPHQGILKARLAAARAIPARTARDMELLRAAASLFNRHDADANGHGRDGRNQARKMRTLFMRHGIDEALFFARASTDVLSLLRRGAPRASNASAPVGVAFQGAD